MSHWDSYLRWSIIELITSLGDKCGEIVQKLDRNLFFVLCYIRGLDGTPPVHQMLESGGERGVKFYRQPPRNTMTESRARILVRALIL